jgi:hypothetical protein
MNHIPLAILIQLLLSPFGWWLGALFAIGYYLGREMAQAEYRLIQKHYGGKRANMPWWGAFQRRAWDVKSILDWALPSLAVIIVAIVAPRLI